MMKCWETDAFKRPSFMDAKTLLSSELYKLAHNGSSSMNSYLSNSYNELRDMELNEFSDSHVNFDSQNLEADDEHTGGFRSNLLFKLKRNEANKHSSSEDLRSTQKSVDIIKRMSDCDSVMTSKNDEKFSEDILSSDDDFQAEKIISVIMKKLSDEKLLNTSEVKNRLSENLNDSNYESASSYYSSSSTNKNYAEPSNNSSFNSSKHPVVKNLQQHFNNQQETEIH